MVLSSELISQFVKATKDEPTSKKETVVYGIVTQTDPIYVKLIDSNSDIDKTAAHTEAIPVASTTTVVEVGDKVACTIKNHKLSITGTTEYPAARNANTVDVDQLNASNARIDNLETANVTVQGTLDAHQAVIDELDATYARIDELDAKYITAEEIETDYLTAEHINSTFATISALEAVDAKIDNLDVSQGNIDHLTSEIAEINTLIFGSATGDVIQSSFSNAVIAQLGDAQIKSAMIESVSASKITAGDIITNNVRVMSEDGSLIISDETLQISDDSRVRVQIGKDASGDYSINVWDQNGNLMFSKGGITDAAIKEAIIRNDMVSDTANIHASKLDIDSLFEEINDDGSNTIKSTKVYLDEEEQTLDVAFKSLTTEVTDQGEVISSQGTAISTIQGQISSKIWQQDINTAKNEMSTQYSTLEQNVDNFKTTVSSTYSTKSDLENLKIGGRNLLLNSAGPYTPTDGREYMQTGHDLYPIFKEHGLVEYTISMDIKSTDISKVASIQVYLQNGSGSYHSFSKSFVVTTEWARYSFTFIPTENVDFADKRSLLAFYGVYGSGNFPNVKNIKLEKGNKATDWTPAPEDIEDRLTSAETTITQNTEAISLRAFSTDVVAAKQEAINSANQNTANLLENYSTTAQMQSAIDVKASGILSTVQSTYATKSTVSTLEQTAEGLTLRLDNQKIGGTNLLNDSEKIISTTRFIQVNTKKALQDCIGKQITIGFDIKLNDGGISRQLSIYPYQNNGVSISGTFYVTPTSEWQRFYITTYVKDWGINNTTYTEGAIAFYDYTGTNNYSIRKVKIELGNTPTEWNMSPYDITNSVLNASKTATNYLNFSSSGLVIGDLTSSTLGKNVLIDSDSVDIRNSDTTLASFGADYLYLAKNSRNATIDLCNGLAKMYHQSRLSYDTLFVIETPNATEIRGTSDPLCVTSTVASKPAIKFANADGVLGSIGMVASGTESYITRNHPSTSTTYSILDTGNYYKLMDSVETNNGSWFYLPVDSDSGFTIYDNNSNIRYRKIGKLVEVVGAIKPTADIAGSTTNYTICTLPTGYRPAMAFNNRCQGSGANSWLFSITTGGVLRFSRYNNGSSFITASTGTWLPLHAMFFTD